MNLPSAFIEHTQSLLGDSSKDFFEALQQPSPITIRWNAQKHTLPNLTNGVLNCENGFYLDQRPSFTLDPYFHSGAYYVQEASSMSLYKIIKEWKKQQVGPARVLDLCAAPGGKSTLIQSLLDEHDFLVANEPISSRNHILTENLVKWGKDGFMVTQNYPQDFSNIQSVFDLMLIDAPCSGEGMFRRDEKSIQEWKNESPAICSSRQQEIIQNTWGALKPGGWLVYSTCTYNTQENEGIAEWLVNTLGAENLYFENLLEGAAPLFSNQVKGYRFFPHLHKGEGFAAMIFRKPDDQPIKPLRPEKRSVFQKAELPLDSYHIPQGRTCFQYKDTLFGLSSRNKDFIDNLQKHLRIRQVGGEWGTLKGKNFIPSHHLAMSYEVNSNEPAMSVAMEDALNYLARQNAPTHPQRGWQQVAYSGLILGWIKSMGNRSNNSYPKEWAIRMTIPQEIPTPFWV